jgi:hypothetical protein
MIRRRANELSNSIDQYFACTAKNQRPAAIFRFIEGFGGVVEEEQTKAITRAGLALETDQLLVLHHARHEETGPPA